MKVLWIVNIIFPEVALKMGLPETVFGGWMVGLSKELLKIKDFQLSIATVFPVETKKKYEINGINYYILPSQNINRYNKKLESEWSSLIEDEKPDVIHIHGTEFPHGLAFINGYGTERVVVSIQGLIGEIYNSYFASLSKLEILKNITIRDLIRGSIFKNRLDFKKRASYEKETLKKINYVIGRTEWDKKCVTRINPELLYFHSEETLRSSFYNGLWEYSKCEKNTLYLSQGGYPLKGLHILLKALSLVKKEIPNIKLYIGGPNVTSGKKILGFNLISGYGKIIKNLIRKLGIKENVIFLGFQNEDEVKHNLLNTNLFISSSIIENSPNSLGEAQLIGVPVVASKVGGVPSMILNESCGKMYRCDDVNELADIILISLKESSNFNNAIMRDIAHRRHNGTENVRNLLEIYKTIINNK